jgi:mannosyl-3-phosphoglycerate phosphatase
VIVIFTDLDGSLLDFEDYSYEKAKPSLTKIRHGDVPLIMTTSKTRREVERLQKEMGIHEPFIIENGNAIFFPENYRGFSLPEGIRHEGYVCMLLGNAYTDIRHFIEKHRRAGIRGFRDMDVKEIMHHTGLPHEEALLAKEREFSEPVVLAEGCDVDALAQQAHQYGLTLVRGGRFHHLSGEGQDKGRAVAIVTDIFRKQMEKSFITVGIGDSANDLPMLERVDVPILIPRHDGSFADMEMPNLRKARYPGSRGWNDMMEEILNDPA